MVMTMAMVRNFHTFALLQQMDKAMGFETTFRKVNHGYQKDLKFNILLSCTGIDGKMRVLSMYLKSGTTSRLVVINKFVIKL